VSGNLKVIAYKPINRGKLVGFLDVFIPSVGIEIYGLTAFESDGRRWFNLPSREYEDKDTGQKKYSPIMRFPNEAYYNAFMNALRKEFDAYCMKQEGPSALNTDMDGRPLQPDVSSNDKQYN